MTTVPAATSPNRRAPLAGGLAAAFLGAACYGLNIPAAKVAIGLGVDGASMIALRAGVLLVVFAVAALATGWRPRCVAGDAVPQILLGLTSAGTAIGYISAVGLLPVSVAVVVFYTFPLWIILYTIARQGRRAMIRLVAFALAFSGILLVIGGTFSALDPRGLALALFASLCSAAMFVAGGKIRSDRASTLFFVQWPNVAAAGLLLWWLGTWPAAPVLQKAALPVLISALGYYAGFTLQVVASQRLNPAAAGLMFLFEPVVAIVASVVLLGEAMPLTRLCGIALVLAGLIADVLLERRRVRRVSA